jgi:hypothetical protein
MQGRGELAIRRPCASPPRRDSPPPPAHLLTQRRIGRRGAVRRRVEHLCRRTSRDRQAKTPAEDRCNLLQRDSEVCMYQHDKVTAPGPGDVGRAQRIGGLQRMTSLRPSATVGATSHVHLEPPDHGTDDRKILLILPNDQINACLPDRRIYSRSFTIVGYPFDSGCRPRGVVPHEKTHLLGPRPPSRGST